MLNAACEAVLLASDRREAPERVEVDAHLGNAAVWQDDATVARSGLDADLADRLGAIRQQPEVAVEVGAKLLLRRIRLADLADLATHADRDAIGLQVADEAGELGGVLGVHALLIDDRRLRQINE